jgi:large subunit ribosomal protein L29
MATAAEIVELDGDELETRLNETRRELFNLRFQLATGQLDNFSRMSHVRKDIARLLTELRAREIAEAEGLAVEDIPVHQAVARQQAEDKKLGRTRIPAAERRAAERAEENQDAEDEGAGAEAKTEDEVEDEAASTGTVTASAVASDPAESADAADAADEDVKDVEEEG